MPRDYKSSSYRAKKPQKKLGLDSWDRLLMVVFISILALVVKHFIVVEQKKTALPSNTIVAINKTDAKVSAATTTVATVAKEVIAAGELTEEELNANPEQHSEQQKVINNPPRQDTIPEEPHFDFYTILPKVEVVIPDHEIKTRIREEKNGTGDANAQYIIQAGSFRDSPEAELLKTKLTAMGIESRVEKAQVGKVMWYRVKVGPYAGMSSVLTIKTQLRNSGTDAIVLEFK